MKTALFGAPGIRANVYFEKKLQKFGEKYG